MNTVNSKHKTEFSEKINQQSENSIWPKIKLLFILTQVDVQASRGCGYTEVSNFTSQSYSQNPSLGVKAKAGVLAIRLTGDCFERCNVIYFYCVR